MTRFNQEDLAQYARDHSISVEEANQKLQSLYGNQLTDNLDTHLRGQGFTKGTNDIHYSTYNGIGEGSGQATHTARHGPVSGISCKAQDWNTTTIKPAI